MTLQIDPERTELKQLRRYADFTSRNVLEIGCGDGRLTWGYAKFARTVTGIDLHADDLRVASLDRPGDLEDKVGFTRADSIYLPFSNETFNIAILAWSF